MAFNMTLDQEEIEKALDIHVRSLVPGLSAETKIGIALSATRGPSGFTAAIDLNPTAASANTKAVTAHVETEVVQESKPVEPKPTTVKVKTSGTKPLNIAAKAAQAKATPVTEEITQTSDTAELPVETVTETAVTVVTQEELDAVAADAMDLNAPAEENDNEAELEVEVAEVLADPAPEPEQPRKSLFAKMSKPQN